MRTEPRIGLDVIPLEGMILPRLTGPASRRTPQAIFASTVTKMKLSTFLKVTLSLGYDCSLASERSKQNILRLLLLPLVLEIHC